MIATWMLTSIVFTLLLGIAAMCAEWELRNARRATRWPMLRGSHLRCAQRSLPELPPARRVSRAEVKGVRVKQLVQQPYTFSVSSSDAPSRR